MTYCPWSSVVMQIKSLYRYLCAYIYNYFYHDIKHLSQPEMSNIKNLRVVDISILCCLLISVRKTIFNISIYIYVSVTCDIHRITTDLKLIRPTSFTVNPNSQYVTYFRRWRIPNGRNKSRQCNKFCNVLKIFITFKCTESSYSFSFCFFRLLHVLRGPGVA
jgi:hypothetical protein